MQPKTMSWDKVTQLATNGDNKHRFKSIHQVNPEHLIETIEAFRNNDMYTLSQLSPKLNGVLWYEFLSKKAVISNVNPIMSNILNMILRSKVNSVFNNIEFSENEYLNEKDLKEIFKDLVSYGEIIVLFDTLYNNLTKEEEYTHKVLNRDYIYDKNRYTGKEMLMFEQRYVIEGELYILVRTFEDTIEKKELYKTEVHPSNKVELSLLHHDLKDEENYQKKMFYKLSYEFNSTNIIGILNEIDANKTQISYINSMGMPFEIDPSLLRMEAGDVNIDDTRFVDVRARKYEGTVKPDKLESLEGSEQIVEPTYVTPDIQIETYTKSIDALIRDLCRYFGVSPTSLNYEGIGANMSGTALKELTELTELTKQNDRSELEDFIKEISLGLDVNLEIYWVDPSNVADAYLLTHYQWMFTNGLLSKEGARRLSLPDFSVDEWNKEDLEILKDRNNGVDPTIKE